MVAVHTAHLPPYKFKVDCIQQKKQKKKTIVLFCGVVRFIILPERQNRQNGHIRACAN